MSRTGALARARTRERRSDVAALLAFALGVSALSFATHGVCAQESPPSGPAQIFNRGAAQRDKGDVARAAGAAAAASGTAQPAQNAPDAAVSNAPAAAPNAAAAQAPEQAADAREAVEAPHDHAHAALAPPSLPSATEASELAPGTIGIDVLSATGAAYPGAQIVLGVMSSSSARTEQRATADGTGHYTFKGLAVGSGQAYRVNVQYSGAKFSSTPFRLPENAGYRVRIPLKEVTRNDRMFIQLVGQTMVELRDDRLHITQQARLANAGDQVFVLPQDGLVIPLPEGYTAFQWQDQMTDQRGEEVAGKGFRMRGSFPPGTVNLAWTFDVPRSGTSARIPVNLPWKTYSYFVASEAPEGLKLRVTDFPEPKPTQYQGRSLLFTEIQNEPGKPALAPFSIKLDGIPGPGPGRWVATVLAALLVGFGLWRALKRGDDSVDRKLFIEKRKQQLLLEARSVDEEHARGESGPEYLARRLNEIEIELALLLRDEESMKGVKASA